MKASAGSRLCQLRERYIEVTVQTSLQRRAMFELTAEWRGLHLPGGARTLHQGAKGRGVHAQHQRDPEHTFVADEADFEIGLAIDRSDQRDEASGGEVHVANGLTRLVEHLAKVELNRLATRQQMSPILAG